jgi:hypothetical protein
MTLSRGDLRATRCLHCRPVWYIVDCETRGISTSVSDRYCEEFHQCSTSSFCVGVASALDPFVALNLIRHLHDAVNVHSTRNQVSTCRRIWGYAEPGTGVAVAIGGSDCGNRAGYYGRVHFTVVVQRGVCIAVQFKCHIESRTGGFLDERILVYCEGFNHCLTLRLSWRRIGIEAS